MAEKTKGLGRTAQVTFRITPQDAKKLARIAKARRMSQADVIERFIRSEPEPLPEELEDK